MIPSNTAFGQDCRKAVVLLAVWLELEEHPGWGFEKEGGEGFIA